MKTLDTNIDKIVVTLDVTAGRSASASVFYYNGAKVIANSLTSVNGADAFARVGVELDGKWEEYRDGKLANRFEGSRERPVLYSITFSTNSPTKTYVLRKV